MRKLICLTVTTFLLAFSGAVSARWVPLREESPNQRPEFVMLDHSAQGDRFEMHLPGVNLTEALLDGRRWDRVEIYGGGFEQELGKPEVPHVTRLLAIPAQAGVRVEAEILEERIIPGLSLMPAQGIAPDEGSDAGRLRHQDEAVYQSNHLYPETLALAGEPALMRDVRVIPIQINPIRFNPVTQNLHIAHRIEVRVTYEGTDLRNAADRPARPMSASWGRLMRSSVINFDDVIDVNEDLMGSYLVICENSPNLVSALENALLDWKRRMGHQVALQTFSPGTSNYGILSMVQTAYNTWEVPPEYVLLVGDASGDFVLPGWNYYVGDHSYSQLAGNDILADVAVGRIPAENMTEAWAMINKVLWYEKQPYTYHDQWFHQAVVVAGEQISGISTIQTKSWIKTRMLENGYTQVDTFWYTMGGSPSATIANSINSGVTYFNYRGYIGVSGWTNSNTNALTNGFMLPFVTVLTCGTGGFSGESVSEHFAAVGTSSTGQGAVAAVGTATSGTNTRCNNVVDVGMYQGLFNEDITQAGSVLVRGKLELYNAYATINSGYVSNFSEWNNLAGDPGLELWTGPIQYLQAEVPGELNLGDNQFDVLVTDTLGSPIEGARVCAYKAGEVQTVALTSEDGFAYLLVDPQTPGDLKVTVTKHNYKPVLDSLVLVQQPVEVGFYSAIIDDDAFGESQGDGDGTINPGEIVEVPIMLKNYGSTTTATSVVLTASLSDPYITPGDMFETYNSIPPGSTSPSLDDIDFQVELDAPDGHIVHVDLAISSLQGNWSVAFELPVAAAALVARSGVTAVGGTVISPGETADMMITVNNSGGHAAGEVTATLRSLDPLMTVSDSVGTYDLIEPGSTAANTSDFFTVTASPDIPRGWQAPMRLEFVTSEGVVQVDTFDLSVGEKTSSDPQGPDSYGYYCYDNTDVNYPPHPVYSWMEIDPDYGGPGTQLPIFDWGEDQDRSINVPLPFTLRYYGIEVDTITVCSNGWISMVPNVAFNLFRNWPIPSAPGPEGMVAPFWDDLTTQGEGRIYAWTDEANHLMIIEWSRMQNFGWPNPQETFEVILYDPDYYPTPTGDGEILFQYLNITEVSGAYWDNAYSTIGIESPDQCDGIEVVYSNQYHDPAAATLQNGRAYFFTTRFDYSPPGGDLQLTLEPINPPIVIPPAGGQFNYLIGLENTGTTPQSADVWCNVLLPNGTVYGPVLGPVNVTINAGAYIDRNRTQIVPGSAPAGIYQYRGYVGVHPNVVVDSAYFEFSKTGLDAQSGLFPEWENTGEPWGDLLTKSAAEMPQTFSIKPAYPNPFNPITTLRFSLPQAARVSLSIYDISGRLVTTLVDGWRYAGTHDVTFDGSNSASGIYIYRLNAGDFTASGKMVLVK